MSRRVVLAVIAVVVIAVSFALSCGGKSSSPTNPYGGGGGGGGGGAAELNSGNIGGSGGVFAHTFNTAGTFNYHCTIHGLAMGGTVTVLASGAPTSESMNVVNDAYQEVTTHSNSVSIMVGGTVTWTNNSGTTHTVTSN